MPLEIWTYTVQEQIWHRMDKSFWVSRCRAVEVSGSVGRRRPKKTWEEAIKMDLRERKFSKDLARDRLAWKSIF